MRLWQTGDLSVDESILAFTTGDDPDLDEELLPYDCLASAAHARMLGKIGILTSAERDTLLDGLRDAFALASAGGFVIKQEDEDGHTALEHFLVDKCGDAGLKIHTGRSRNDQVIAATRLMVRHQLALVADSVLTVADTLHRRAAEEAETLMPGFTHTRQAMPSTVGQLFGSVAEGLIRDLEALEPALKMSNRSALGSASGYGVPLPLDRAFVAQLLKLDAVDENTIYVQNTRGRLEALSIMGMHQLSVTISRFATDLIWFSSEAFGYFSLPTALTTGSSIMPQKRNPDVLELLRAMPGTFLGRYTETMAMLPAIGSGYHRDLQRAKAPLLTCIGEMRGMLAVMERLVNDLEVNPDACEDALDTPIYATDHVYAHVKEGVPFREAYRRVKDDPPGDLSRETVLQGRTHIGAPGQSSTAGLLLDTFARRIGNYLRGHEESQKVLEIHDENTADPQLKV